MTRAELPERIETERLVLRVRTVADAEDIHIYSSLPEVAYPAFRELGLHKIELSCFGYNVQSQRVAEKLGFTLEARIRDRKDVQGNRCDDLRYGLLRSEWEVI